jgi:hypothetical protein
MGTLSTRVKGAAGEVVTAQTYSDGDHEHVALEVATRPALHYIPRSIFFSNPTFGVNLNQNAAFGGTPDGIHNGTDSVLWTASALSGAWDFASTAQSNSGTRSIDATSTTNGDQALFSRSSAVSSASYTAISGFVYLTTFNATRHEIQITLRLAGANSSLTLDITDFVDVGQLDTWQKWVIPFDTILPTGSIDELLIQTVRASGNQPDYYLDDIQLEETGSIVYTCEPARGVRYEFDTLELFLVDALDTTLLNGTMPNLSYDKILGLPALSGGINLRLTTESEVRFSGTFSDLGDILFAAFEIIDIGCDGTNTFLKLRAKLSDFVVMRSESRDKIELTLSDNLSGLLRFRANIRGRERINADEGNQ